MLLSSLCFFRRVVAVVFFFGAGSLALATIEIGDPLAKVLEEKGAPIGRMQAGTAEILRFSDQTIRLKNGRVVAIDAVVERSPRPSAPSVPARRRAPAEAAPAPVSEPEYPKGFVGTPAFRTSVGTRAAGTAFLAKREGDSQVYVVTAHHLFGPSGGFPAQISHAGLPEFVHGVRLAGIVGPGHTTEVHAVVVPDEGENSVFDDLAVLKAADVPEADAATLSSNSPPIGATVWIFARVRGGVPENQVIHRARVVEFQGQLIVCEFADAEIITNGASGAPALGADGKVVGVYTGHRDADGKKLGYLIPSSAVIETIMRQ